MGRWVGLDVGDKRVGVAFSDPLGLTAQAHSILHRKKLAADLAQLHALARDWEAELWVVGLPRHMNGEEGEQAERTRAFAEALGALSGLPLRYVDERLSTRQAELAMREVGLDAKQRKAQRDAQAAAVILQVALDQEATRRRRAEEAQAP